MAGCSAQLSRATSPPLLSSPALARLQHDKGALQEGHGEKTTCTNSIKEDQINSKKTRELKEETITLEPNVHEQQLSPHHYTTSLGIDRKHAEVVMYTIWNLWKEHYKRVFDNKEQTPAQITSLFQQDILLFEKAYGKYHVNN